MDHRAVTSQEVVKISRLASHMPRSAWGGPDPKAVRIKLLIKKYKIVLIYLHQRMVTHILLRGCGPKPSLTYSLPRRCGPKL